MWLKLKRELTEFKLLVRSVPSVCVALFIISVFAMNLLANKSISLGVDWLALDCGIIVSWFAFLTMDIITKHYGPKASTQISFLAIAVNLVFCLFMFIASKIPGIWGEQFGDASGAIGGALDNTFGGTWYVLLGSTVAFAVSALVNNFVNFGVGKLFKKNPDGALAYILRSYVSTAVGQFLDNLIFAFIVSHTFFGWSAVQCVTCAVTGMLVELACEAVFSYFGFWVCKKWKKDGVGAEYFAFVNSKPLRKISKPEENEKDGDEE